MDCVRDWLKTQAIPILPALVNLIECRKTLVDVVSKPHTSRLANQMQGFADGAKFAEQCTHETI